MPQPRPATLCVVLVLGCSGTINGMEPGEPGPERQPPGEDRPVRPSQPESPTSEPGCRPTAPAVARLRRLTNREYENVVRDLLGKKPAGLTAGFPPDAVVDGFDNDVETLTVSPAHTERYRDAAERVATAFLETARATPSVLGCDPAGAGRVGCLRKVAADLGRRAFRRPLRDDELGALVTAADAAATDPDPLAGVGLVVEALLQAPSFLYRAELGTPDPARPGWLKLDGHEVAARLSFLLWGTAPDATLLDAASSGKLATADGIVATAEKMLGDARAKDAMRTFATQWLRLSDLATTEISTAVHPAWSEGLRTSMLDETRQFVNEVLWSGDVRGLLDARFSFVDSRLAKHYGLRAAPTGTSFTRVTFTDEPRGGLLTHASILTAQGREEGLAPILRGKYVRDVLLCSSPPEPPADVPPLPAPKAGQSVRQQLEAHRTNVSCAGCHRLLDAVGFGLENYDLLGRHRTADASGKPLTGEGTVEGLDTPRFVGARELAARIRDSADHPRCVTRQLFRYTFGRADVQADACFVSQVSTAFRDGGHGLKALLLAFVGSEAFRHAREEESR